MVPHLPAALTGPLLLLERRFLDRMPEIERWLRAQWQQHAVPFCGAVDLRNAGFKLAPVDTSLSPGGFNHLNAAVLPLCVQAMQAAVERACADARGVLLIPESHASAPVHLQHIATLAAILRQSGVNVRIGSIDPGIGAPTAIALPLGGTVTLEPVVRSGRRVGVAGFDPCMVLLNSSASASRAAVLEGIEQPIAPLAAAGLEARRRSTHFAVYRDVARRFAELIGVDPWLLDPHFDACGEVDLRERAGEERLQSSAASLLRRISAKYAEYGIEEKPFVIVKSDTGTCGKGIMTVRDAADVVDLVRRQCSERAVGEDGPTTTSVILQESVPTFEAIHGAIAEPVVCTIDRFVVGGYYRVHTGRARDENRNAPGARFVPLAFESPCIPDLDGPADCPPNRFYAYGVVARLALLAAAIEVEAPGGGATA